MIETQRLLLRPMRTGDVDPLLRVFGDPKVMAAFDAEPFDRDQMAGWVRRNLDHQDRHGYGLFSVILKANGELIGNCGLEMMGLGGVDAAADAAADAGPGAAAPTAVSTAIELGYDFRSDVWNQGNRASRRVAEKIGMRPARDLDRSGVAYWLFMLDAPDQRPDPGGHDGN